MATLLSVITASWRPALLACALAITGCDGLNPPDPTLALTLDGSEIVASSIDDGLVQAGESVSLDLFVTNASLSAYERVVITSSHGNPGEEPLRVQSVRYPAPDRNDYDTIERIEPGQTVRLVATAYVHYNTPAGTSLPFEVTLTTPDGVAATFTVPLTVSALPYAPTIEGVVLLADSDSDGRVEPGEEATMGFTVPIVPGPYAERCYNDAVSTTLAQVVMLTVDRSDCYERVRRFRFRVSSTVAAGTALPFVIRVRDRYGNTWDFSVSIPLG